MVSKITSSGWTFAGLWILFVIGTAVLSHRFPAVDTDEVFIGVHGYNLLSGKGDRYSLFDDIYAPPIDNFRDAFGQVEETVYNTWVGLWLKICRHYWVGRCASLSAGCLAVGMFYAIGCAIRNRPLGLLLGLLLMVDPIFITASSLIRPETLLLLSSAVVLWLILKLPPNFFLKGFWIGLLSGLQVAIHPNALALLPGFWVLAFCLEERRRRASMVGTLIVGAGGGILLALLSTDLHRLWLAHETFVAQMSRPPLFSPPHSLGGLFHLITAKALMTQTSFPDDPRGQWRMGLTLRYIGIGGGLLGISFAPGEDSTRKALFYGLLVSFLATVALVAQKELSYQVNLYPFLLPLIALYGVQQNRSLPVIHRILKALSGLSILGSFCFFLLFANDYWHRYTPFPEVQSQLAALVPDQKLKMVAPNLFWFQWPVDRFRDLGAMSYSHWLSGGQRDVSLWLGRWSPTIIVVDPPFKRIFLGPGPTALRLAHVLNTGVRYIGTIDTRNGSYGPFEVYEVRWPQGVK